jgi:NAD-dependent dihydropyrimidine dehydrogenase PreA subunit
MENLFQGCGELTKISWQIDMSSCTNCTNMFTNCPATSIKLKNVPSTLNLSNIGTTKYTVVNYI